MRVFILIIALVFAAGCETEKQKARKAEMHQLRLDSWNACIGAGGSPIEGWSSSPPAMRRCDYPPQHETDYE